MVMYKGHDVVCVTTWQTCYKSNNKHLHFFWFVSCYLSVSLPEGGEGESETKAELYIKPRKCKVLGTSVWA